MVKWRKATEQLAQEEEEEEELVENVLEDLERVGAMFLGELEDPPLSLSLSVCVWKKKKTYPRLTIRRVPWTKVL